jgi:hypothetical protein
LVIKSLGIRGAYEGGFIFAVLLQITVKRDVWLLPNFLPFEHKLAVESLAIQL